MTRTYPIILLLVFISFCSYSQGHLSKIISLDIKSQPIKEVLTIISNEGEFNFSYNSKAVNRDSLISFSIQKGTVLQALRKIFDASYEFKETGAYVIIRRKSIATSSVVLSKPTTSEHYFISGTLIDEETGERLADATVYEKINLISTLTDQEGKFSLKLKNKYKSASLSFSKDGYIDTTVNIQSNVNQKMTIALVKNIPTYIHVGPEFSSEYLLDNDNIIHQPVEEYGSKFSVEWKWISNLLMSSKQRIRSLNLKRFYTTRAYQISLIPGVGTHGKMTPQVTSDFSINILGGYSGGTRKLEVGTLFNIDKLDVKYVQLAGLFNIVGKNVHGLQASSLYNEVGDTMKGVQVGGLLNKATHLDGVQIATLYNKVKTISGVQIGLINVTESRQGTSIGLLNFSKGRRSKYRIGFLVRLPRQIRK